jgi:hypothetical protein
MPGYREYRVLYSTVHFELIRFSNLIQIIAMRRDKVRSIVVSERSLRINMMPHDFFQRIARARLT